MQAMTTRDATWFPALAPYVERDDLSVALTNPFLRPTGERVDSVPSVSVRLPMWRGAAFTDDLGKKTAAMIELNGEHVFPELVPGMRFSRGEDRPGTIAEGGRRCNFVFERS